MRKFSKVVLVTALCLSCMLFAAYIPYDAKMTSVGVLLEGELTTTEDISGGRPVAKHLVADTSTSITVDSVGIKYLITVKGTGENAGVHDYSATKSSADTDNITLKWDSKTSEMGTTYIVYGTHEFSQYGVFDAVYTSEEL